MREKDLIKRAWKRDAFLYHDRAEVCCTIELAYQSEEHRARRTQNGSFEGEDELRIFDTSSDETRLLHSPLGHRIGTDLDVFVAVSARVQRSSRATYTVFN